MSNWFVLGGQPVRDASGNKDGGAIDAAHAAPLASDYRHPRRLREVLRQSPRRKNVDSRQADPGQGPGTGWRSCSTAVASPPS